MEETQNVEKPVSFWGNQHILVAVLLVAALSIGFFAGFRYFKHYDLAPATQDVQEAIEGLTQGTNYAFPEENNVIIEATTTVPSGWVKKSYPSFNFSVAVPADWQENDLGLMVQGVRLTNPKNQNESIAFAYDYPGFASDTQTLEGRAREELFDVFPLTIAGEKGYRGVFSNAALWLVQIEIYLEHKGITYNITLPSNPSETLGIILSSFVFIN